MSNLVIMHGACEFAKYEDTRITRFQGREVPGGGVEPRHDEKSRCGGKMRLERRCDGNVACV